MSFVFTKEILSGSVSGKPIIIVAVATAGTLIHSTPVGIAGQMDEIYAWVSNVTAIDATLTVEWGGATDPGNHLVHAINIPANSPPIPIATGQPLQLGASMRAFSGTASALNITGYVNRIT